MKYGQIVSKLYCEPMAITKQGWDSINTVVRSHLVGNLEIPKAQEDSEVDFFGNPLPQVDYRDGVAIIPVFGPLIQHANLLEKMCGACSYQDIARNLDSAANRGDVDSIWLNFSSPGGQCVGCTECADKIAEMVGMGFDVYAYTDTEMCSAAYWLASGCTHIFASKSSLVGSIGAMMGIIDESEAFKMLGLKAEVFTSGPLKGTAVEGTSLTDAQRTYLQGLVDEHARQFKDHVSGFRKAAPSAMQGQAFIGTQALEFGLVDENVGTLAAAIESTR